MNKKTVPVANPKALEDPESVFGPRVAYDAGLEKALGKKKLDRIIEEERAAEKRASRKGAVPITPRHVRD